MVKRGRARGVMALARRRLDSESEAAGPNRRGEDIASEVARRSVQRESRALRAKRRLESDSEGDRNDGDKNESD